ncbi:MAG: fibronectin type III domain-containing protein, partial [Bacteroidales bacterium]|nr:fibronectin type III domain-containing protein [Bacteroidales bacterium]
CSSCRVVADFTIANITTESATISWTEQGLATSWELIVSETELDNNALESYNNIISLAEPSYSATGLTIGTQYYVYVRSVCSDDDKSRWKKRTFYTAFCASEDMCEISYELYDPEYYGQGWLGAAIEVVDVETNIILATWKLENGETSKTGTLPVCKNRDIYFNWIEGTYDEYLTAYEVVDANGEEIFSGSGAMASSVMHFVSCPTCQMVSNLQATDITTESATISWSEHGTAQSWNIVVSTRQLEQDALNVSGNIITVTDSTYSVTGLRSSTLY